MPNLCRRSRISPPQQNKIINFPFSSTSSSQNLDNARDYLHKRSEDRLSFFAQLKSWFTSTSNTQVENTSQLDSSTAQRKDSRRSDGMVYTTSHSSLRPNINIGQFLNEDEAEMNEELNKKRTAQRIVKVNKSRGCLSYLTWTFLFLVMFLLALFAMNQIENEKGFKLDETLIQDFVYFYRNKIKSPVIEKSAEIFKESEILFKESESLLQESKKSIDVTLRSATISVGGTFDYAGTIIGQKYKIWKLYLSEKWSIYWPKFCKLVN